MARSVGVDVGLFELTAMAGCLGVLQGDAGIDDLMAALAPFAGGEPCVERLACGAFWRIMKGMSKETDFVPVLQADLTCAHCGDVERVQIPADY